MYNEYFGLSAAPFSIAPDPRYLFMSARHREALAHLLYGLRVDGGFVLLTGEVGTGKTTVCRCLLEQVPDDCDLAFILNPRLDTVELLATLCEELNIPLPQAPHSTKHLVDRLNRFLLGNHARGRRTVLIIDEAQNLADAVLEQLRLLTNLETNERKLLQIILIGQPELRTRLAQPSLRQLAQRVVARYHLEPLSRSELRAYVDHRLAVAGARAQPQLFTAAAIDGLYKLSGGTPRLVNLICDRALLGAYAHGERAVTPRLVRRAAREIAGATPRPRAPWRMGIAAGLLAVAAAGTAAAWHHGLFLATIAGTRDAPPLAAPAPAMPGTDPSATSTATTTLRWPTPDTLWLNEVIAARSLLALWHLDLPANGVEEACRQLAQRDMGCLNRSGELDDLRAMNVPAIIELRQPDGPNFRATLIALDADEASVAIAGTARRVPRAALQAQWTGAYTLLWPMPAAWRRSIGIGMRGSDVAWVHRQLARWEGLPEFTRPSALFDTATEARLRTFQRTNGLTEDGVVGTMTVVRLSTIGVEDAPTLLRELR